MAAYVELTESEWIVLGRRMKQMCSDLSYCVHHIMRHVYGPPRSSKVVTPADVLTRALLAVHQADEPVRAQLDRRIRAIPLTDAGDVFYGRCPMRQLLARPPGVWWRLPGAPRRRPLAYGEVEWIYRTVRDARSIVDTLKAYQFFSSTNEPHEDVRHQFDQFCESVAHLGVAAMEVDAMADDYE